MTANRGDDLFDARLRSVLEQRAEQVAAGSRPAEEMATDLATRLRPRYRMTSQVTGTLRLAWLLAIAVILVALVLALLVGGRTPLVSPRLATIAVDLPLGGSDPVPDQILYGIKAAISDARGRAGGFEVVLPESWTLSHTANGAPDPATGAANVSRAVADPAVVAVIGPFHSPVGAAEIPITNAAGLLQCSPGTTAAGLMDASSSGPAARPNYVRVVTSDDAGARGAAGYLLNTLRRTSVYVIDQGDPYAVALADAFQAEFGKAGKIIARVRSPGTLADQNVLLQAFRSSRPAAIYFAGGGAGAAIVARLAAQAGLGDVPFVGGDALLDGAAAVPGSFLNVAGVDATNAFAAFPGVAGSAGLDRFNAAYRTEFGASPSPYAAAGYACAQVVMDTLGRVDARVPAAALRERVRAAAVDPAASFDTILGTIRFNSHGDLSPQPVSVLGYDAATRDWAFRASFEVAAAP